MKFEREQEDGGAAVGLLKSPSWKPSAGLGPQEWRCCTEPLICPAATASGTLVLLDLHPALEPTAAPQPGEQTAELELHTKRASECELQYQEEGSGSPCPVQEPNVEPAEAPCSTGQSRQAEQDGPTQPCAVTQSGQVWEHCIDGCWSHPDHSPKFSAWGWRCRASHGTWPVTVLAPLSCVGHILPAPQLTVLPLSPLQFVICVRGQVSGKAAMPQEKPAGKGCPRHPQAIPCEPRGCTALCGAGRTSGDGDAAPDWAHGLLRPGPGSGVAGTVFTSPPATGRAAAGP